MKNRLYPFSLLPLFVCIVFAGGEAVQAESRSGSQKTSSIEGSWIIYEMVEEGEAITEAMLMGVEMMLEFNNGNMVFKQDGVVLDRGTYRLDPTKSPKHIDTIDANGRVESGIYTIEGYQLILCVAPDLGQARPTAFLADAGSGRLLFKMRKKQ
jgi:uncharacterized protein (TIGR03067 family)